MSYSDDHIVLAAEYVLGTLDALERVQVETMMSVDPGFKALVHAWELKLGVLNEMVSAAEPPAHLWDLIRARITGMPTPAVFTIPNLTPAPTPVVPPVAAAPAPVTPPAAELPVAVPDAVPPPLAEPSVEGLTAPPPGAGGPDLVPALEKMIIPPPANTQDVPASATVAAAPASPAGNAQVVKLTRSVVRWRKMTGLTTAIAAGLGAYLAVESYHPDWLPSVMRRAPRIETVTVPTPPSTQFVALLQRETTYPAFVMTVDIATKTLTVRRLMAQPEQGKSYELWLVSEKYPQPRSLGVIGGSDFSIQPALASYDADTINNAYYAVSVEPEGGSPTGAATGPIVYTGRLIEAVRPPATRR